MFSIEGSYVGLARWLTVNWAHPGWFPLWYGGIPIENAYPPLLPHLVALFSLATGMTVARSVHAVTAAFYCLGPVALFSLVLRLTQSQWKALAAGWLYSLISLSAFLLPKELEWIRVGAVWSPVRLFALLTHDEAANIAAIALLLAALAAIHAALEYPLGWRTVLAILASASVVLTNWLGAVALVCGALALLIARKRGEHAKPAFGRLVLVGLLAYAVAAPWVPPSDVAVVQRNAQALSGVFPMGRPQYVYLAAWLAAAFAIGLLLKRKTSVPEAGRFALVFLFLMAVPPLGFEYLKIYPLPQPNRYFLEMDAAFALAAGIVLGSRRLCSKWAWSRVVTGMVLACLAIVLVPPSRREVRTRLPRFDITKTVEYEQAVYINAHYPGQRVFVDGSTRYWFNAFADNPQLGGGVDQGRSNPAIAAITFGIPYMLGNGPDTVALLKACGVRAIAVGGEHTRDAYRDYRDPAKFAGIVPEVWRDGDDVIYEIPGSGSLAHIVSKGALVTTDPLDYPALTRYAAALDADANTRIVWSGPNRATIKGSLARPQVLSLQISYDPGWRATANGAAIPTQKDALGFLVLKPDCHGSCTIDLIYDGGLQRRVMDFLCVLGFTACAWMLYRQYRQA
ncbi:MAG: hypothetical protein LAO55_06470 [Acidobacteriia bacterium]|nr:hypothetical protein [Terriglobia bacterium]